MAIKKKLIKKKAVVRTVKRAAKPAAQRSAGKAAAKKTIKKPVKKLIVKKKAIRAAAKPASRNKAIKKAPAKKPQTRKSIVLNSRKEAAQVRQPAPAAIPVAAAKPFEPRPAVKPIVKPTPKTKVKVRPVYTTTLTPQERRLLRSARAPQYNYMKAPGVEHAFEVGDTVEVFCDHEKSGERVRGWIKGIVVQVDNKMVAVQFRSNVFLTDGWMVPDRILWYPVTSDQIRVAGTQKKLGSKELPEY